MKKFREKMVPEISSYVCDRRGREAEAKGGEAEELVSIDRVSYCSFFGDGNRISVDICQYCLKEVLGEWLRIVPLRFS